MNKNINFKDNKNFTSDAVINKGYAIYDEWTSKKHSSRKIVDSVNNAVSTAENKNNTASRLNALSHLFALDMRIKERYNSILRCIFLYFAWRRETNALKSCNITLNIIATNDIRYAIEIELKKMSEQIDDEASDDGDDNVSGGKRNGKLTEEAVSKEARQQDNTIKEKNTKASENDNSEEYSEEIIDEAAEQNINDEQLEKQENKQEKLPAIEEKRENALQNNNEKSKQTAIDQLNKENNGHEEKSEQNIENSKTDINNYIDPVVESFLTEESKSSNKSDNFIDNDIFKNNTVESKNNVNSNPISNSITDERTQENQNTEVEQNQEDNASEKNYYLYDNMLNNGKDAEEKSLDKLSQLKTDAAKLQSKEQVKAQSKEQLKTQSKEQLKSHLREKTNEHSKEQLRERLNNKPKNQSQTQSKTDAKSIKNDFKKLRVPIKIDLGNTKGNDVRQSVNENTSNKSIELPKISQKNETREQLNIASNELGIDAKNKIIEKNEPLEIKQSKVELNKK